MIELINVSKYYPTEFGRHYVFRNVSLKLPLDKSVGVIGPNGAGKSTFLRLLGGADIPSEGKILRTGRISPPMGLTPGLQATLNGVENARFAGRIDGMARDEIADLIDYVRETANIGKFFDMPVGTYSAGMRQRVAFAINMSMTFDYYLFDEIGAGGDREFRKTGKAMIAERLKTSKFIIASHRTDELLDLCESGIVIKDGELIFYDDINDALVAYNTEDDEDEERLAKRAARFARKAGAEGGEAASAEHSSETKSKRKAKRASRKARKSKGDQADTAEKDATVAVADAIAAEPPLPTAHTDPEAAAPAADPQETSKPPDDRETRRTERRARKGKTAVAAPDQQPAAPPDESAPAVVSPDVRSPRPKPRGEEAIGAAAPDTSEGFRGDSAAQPPPQTADLSLDTKRQARRARKLEEAAGSRIAEAVSLPEPDAASAESRSGLKAHRIRLREARLKAKADETGQPLIDQAESDPGAPALHPPGPARPRGDEAVGTQDVLQTPSVPGGGQPIADANSPGETRTGSDIR